jgi:hypothetical protein
MEPDPPSKAGNFGNRISGLQSSYIVFVPYANLSCIFSLRVALTAETASPDARGPCAVSLARRYGPRFSFLSRYVEDASKRRKHAERAAAL